MSAEALMRGIRPGDVDELCEGLRAADEAEIIAGGQETGADGVRFAVSASHMAWALEYDGEVGALFGLRVYEPGRCVLWMLTSYTFGRHPRAFVRCIRRQLPLLRTLGELFNFIDGRYTGALRLAAALGATFGSPIDRNGHVFVPFSFGRL